MIRLTLILVLFFSASIRAEMPLKIIQDFNDSVVNSDSANLGFQAYENKFLFFSSIVNSGVGRSLFSYDIESKQAEKLISLPFAELKFSGKTDNGLIFFEKSGSKPASLWISNGTKNGTTKLFETTEHSYNNKIHTVQLGNQVVFALANSLEISIYITDGTIEGTTLLNRFSYPTGYSTHDLIKFIDVSDNNVVYYDGYRYNLLDLEGNKTQSCYWAKEAERSMALKGKVIFRGKEQEGYDLLSCDLESAVISNLGALLDHELSDYWPVIRSDKAIYLSTEDTTIKYDLETIIYETAYGIGDQLSPPQIIDQHLVAGKWGADRIYVDDQQINFPEMQNHQELTQMIPCLSGVCYNFKVSLYENENKYSYQLWYVELGQTTAEKLYETAFGESILGLGAYLDDKLIFTGDSPEYGTEPRIFDFSTNSSTLAVDINSELGTDTSKMSNVHLFEDRFYFSVDTSRGRETWIYDPVNDETIRLDDDDNNEFYSDNRKTLIDGRLYHEVRPYNDNPCRGGLEYQLVFQYDPERQTSHFNSCSGLGRNFTKFEDGYIYVKSGGAAYFKAPIYRHQEQSLPVSLGYIQEVQKHQSKVYILSSSQMVILDEKDFSYTTIELTEDLERRTYIGEGQWLFDNGQLFDGSKITDTEISKFIDEDGHEPGNHRIYDGYAVMHTNNVEEGTVIFNIREWPYVKTIFPYHILGPYYNYEYQGRLYSFAGPQVSHGDATLYRDDFKNNTREVLKTLDRSTFYGDWKFHKSHLYIAEYNNSQNNNTFKRINLLTGNEEQIADSERGLESSGRRTTIDVENLMSDSFGNLYFTKYTKEFGDELWKYSVTNKLAAQRSYVIHHQSTNTFNFPVSYNNSSSEFSIVSTPTKGVITIDGNKFTYVPKTGESGIETVDFKFHNDSGHSNIGKLKLFINEVPVARADVVKTVMDASDGLYLFPTLNDYDDGPIKGINFMIVDEPKHSTFKPTDWYGRDYFRLTAEKNYYGHDSFSYKLVDNEGDASETVRVDLNFSSISLNGRPIANDDEYTIAVNTSKKLEVLVNDTDPDDDLFRIHLEYAKEPQHGKVRVDNNTIEYTPDTGFTGTDQFAYWIEDEYGQTSPHATVSIGVGQSSTASNESSGSGTFSLVYLIYLTLLLSWRRRHNLNQTSPN